MELFLHPSSPARCKAPQVLSMCLLIREQDQLPGSKQQVTHRHRMRQARELWGTGPSFWDFILGNKGAAG